MPKSPGLLYLNPDMPPEVIRALAEAGYGPDGTPLEQGIGSAFGELNTQQRLDGINSRISSDWQGMGFTPPQTVADPRAQYVGNNTDIFMGANSPMANTGPDPFGAETRMKLAGINQRIDADIAAMAPPQPVEAPPAPRNQISGMDYTPALPPAPAPAPAIPKPTPRPRPTAYIVKAGDNPTKIARALGMTLRELEAKNPGIIKRAKRLRIGSTVNI